MLDFMFLIYCSFTKDAYEHFMSSAYPIALTVLDSSHLYHMDILNSNAEHAEEEALTQKENSDAPCLRKKEIYLNADKKVKGRGPEELMGGNCTKTNKINIDKRRDVHCNIHEDLKPTSKYDACNKVIKNPEVSPECLDNSNKEVLSQNSYMDHSIDGLFALGELSLFELNMIGRRLVPGVIIGRTLKMRNSGSPMLLLYEDKSIKKIRL
jgi:hypothetical protein